MTSGRNQRFMRMGPSIFECSCDDLHVGPPVIAGDGTRPHRHRDNRKFFDFDRPIYLARPERLKTVPQTTAALV
jgi:hypothetical protein